VKIVIGLGNPGSRYERTRHNIGWRVIDAVAGRLRAEFEAARGDYYDAQVRWRGTSALLVKPTTFMNNSGQAAAQLVKRYRTPPGDILAIVDELQFPTGRIQIKPSGSSGGQNGIESLITHLGTDAIPRLRCGIGSDFERGAMADYVLSPFPPSEEKIVEEMIANAADAVLVWIAEGTARAMNRCNTKPGPLSSKSTESESER
jgi:peptidyl-tRNA hydrolase, PTH1 family